MMDITNDSVQTVKEHQANRNLKNWSDNGNVNLYLIQIEISAESKEFRTRLIKVRWLSNYPLVNLHTQA